MINLDKYVSTKSKEADLFNLYYVLASEFGYSEEVINNSSVPFLLGLFNKHVERIKAENKAMSKNNKGK
jgi:hypothetical protein